MAEQMIYRAFEGEEMIYEGTRKGLLDALHISHSTPIRRYASEGTLVLGRYRFTVSYKGRQRPKEMPVFGRKDCRN